jgi:hypothetical protein
MIKPLFAYAAIALFSFCGCEKEPTTTDDKTTFKSYSVYEGETLAELQLTNEVSFKYNAQRQLVLKTEKLYEDGSMMGSIFYDYEYRNNQVIETYSSDFTGTKVAYERGYIFLNANNLVEKDSTVDLSDFTTYVSHYTYENGHRIYNYIDDTMNSGSVFAWMGDNQTHEYLISGLMGRFEIAKYEYGNKLNTIDFGDFWLDGEKSKNLPEKCTEPNYEYTYTYKIESDGFVSERITTFSSPGGPPNGYEKIVYHR